MLKNKLLTNLFSSGLQVIAVQILGSVFFYLISVYLSKETFGAIGWMNAASLFLTTILGFGLEQVVVMRIAASNRSDWAAAAFFIHSIAGFCITLLLLLLVDIFTDHSGFYKFLPWFFAAQGLIYIGTPLKQFLNAKERFTAYGIIAIVSNVCKILAVFLLLQKHQLSILSIVTILIITAGFELTCLMFYVITKTTFSFKLHIKAYIKLLKESSAQYLSVIFDISLSRLDWILLGIMTSNVLLADYSFAYRAFELARLPLLILAPVILPKISRFMSANKKSTSFYKQHINSVNTIELFLAALIPLILNILWVPIISLITKGKYGDSNALQFLILSLCIPLQFSINLLWSLSLGAKKYKSIAKITISCAVTNILLNLILIPFFNGLGAAIAFLITIIIQASLYHNLVRKQIMEISLHPFLFFVIAAAVIYIGVTFVQVHIIIRLAAGIILYFLAAILSGLINRQHLYDLRYFLSK